MTTQRDAASPIREVDIEEEAPKGSSTTYIYVEDSSGDDANRGFGDGDPSKAVNWSSAVATLSKAGSLVPRSGATIIVTRGSLTLGAGTFPYEGYSGSCMVVSNDSFTTYASGSIMVYTAAPAKIPVWPECTVSWAGGFVPDDETIRKHFFAYERSASSTKEIVKAGDYDSGDASHKFLEPYPDTANGKAIDLVGPSSALAFTGYTTILNTYFVGYAVTIGAAAGLSLKQLGMAEFYTNRSGFGLCEIGGASSIPLSIFADQTDVFRTYYAPDAFTFLADGYQGAYSAVPGVWLNTTSVSGSRRFTSYTGSQYHYGCVFENLFCYVQAGAVENKYTYMVDKNKCGYELYTGAKGTFMEARVSKISGEAQSPYVTLGNVEFSSDSGGSMPLLELDPGSVVRFHGGVALFKDRGSDNRYLIHLKGTFTVGLHATGGFDLSAPGTPKEAILVDGGEHTDLYIDLDGMDRGVGPLVTIKGAASASVDYAAGSNTNVGAGYGMLVDEKSFVRADKSDCSISGTAGELKVGSKAVAAFPNAGVISTDLTNPPAATDTLSMVVGE